MNNDPQIESDAAKLEALYHDANYPGLEVFARQFTERYPFVGFGWSVLGVALRLQNKDALDAIRQAATLLPGDAAAHSNLGDELQAIGRHEEAIESYISAMSIDDGIAELHNNLANSQKALRQMDRARAGYANALRLKPDLAEAYLNQGVIFNELGEFALAEESLRRAIRIQPESAEAYIELAATLKHTGRPAEAEKVCRTGLQKRPDMIAAYNNLAAILDDLGRSAEAEVAFRHAAELAPDIAHVHSNLLFHISHSNDISATELFREHQLYAERFEKPLQQSLSPHGNARDKDKVLKVGFVSGDFRHHAVANFIEPVLTHLRQSPEVSIYAYSNNSCEDAVTRRIQSSVHNWRLIDGKSDEFVAQLVREDCIDILIDLSGHTAHNRLLVFARKPAPLQASWIGYAGTTGLTSMDYYFGDPYWLPVGKFEDQFSEKIIRLPATGLFQPFSEAPDVSPLPACKNGFLTFGSFNLLRKLTPSVIAVWSQIMRSAPRSRMLLGAMPEAGDNAALIEQFAHHGIESDRLYFHQKLPTADYLHLHHQVDVCLDTFPYPGGTTSCHALWMGVPTVTRVGDTPVSRVGATIQNHAGLTQFIANDKDEFVARAANWASNFDELALIRKTLRTRFVESPMGRPELVGAAFQKALRTMWHRWCDRDAPAAFDV
jgi:protein O-GlcNAc transferase